METIELTVGETTVVTANDYDQLDNLPTLEGTELKGDLTLSDVNAYTKTEVDTMLNAKADVVDIPTKTSDLTNDSGFLTQHQSLADYATKEELEGVRAFYVGITYNSSIPDVTFAKTYDEIVEAYDAGKAIFGLLTITGRTDTIIIPMTHREVGSAQYMVPGTVNFTYNEFYATSQKTYEFELYEDGDPAWSVKDWTDVLGIDTKVTVSGTPEDGQTLTWSASQNAWIPSTPSSGGGANVYLPLQFYDMGNHGVLVNSAELDAVINSVQTNPYNTVILHYESSSSTSTRTEQAVARLTMHAVFSGVDSYRYDTTVGIQDTRIYTWMFMAGNTTQCGCMLTESGETTRFLGERSEGGTWTFALQE